MTVDTEGFREARLELHQPTAELRLVAERLPTLTAYERAELRGRILRHLREQVEPRTRLDEMLLYPEVATRLADPLVDASTNYDRLAIRHWIELIADADVNDTARLQQLFYGLDALIRVHLWKENELLLASLESRSGFPERRIRVGPITRPAARVIELADAFCSCADGGAEMIARAAEEASSQLHDLLCEVGGRRGRGHRLCARDRRGRRLS